MKESCIYLFSPVQSLFQRGQVVEEDVIFYTGEFQLMKAEGLTDFENDHFEIFSGIMDLDNSHRGSKHCSEDGSWGTL